MLSKGSVAIVPPILLLIIWWQRRRITILDLLELAPLFAVAAVLTAVNIWFQTHGTAEAIRQATPAERIVGAGAAVWFYLWKAVDPIELLFIYPTWHIDTTSVLWWIPLAAAVGLTITLWRRRHSRFGAALFFAWTFFVLALLPVLGLVDTPYMRYSLVADHYQHLALIAVVTTLAAAVALLVKKTVGTPRMITIAAAAAIVVGLAVLSHQQAALYADPIKLYEATLAKNPTCSLLQNNLANEFAAHGRPAEARSLYLQAVQADPDNVEAQINVGLLLAKEGHAEQAISHYEKALQVQPNSVAAHYNLGSAQLVLGAYQKAIDEYQWVLAKRPDYTGVHYNLGNAFFSAGRLREAAAEYRHALQLEPENADAYNNLGNTFDGARPAGRGNQKSSPRDRASAQRSCNP